MTITHFANCEQCQRTEPAKESCYAYLMYGYPDHWVSVRRDGKSRTVCSPKCAVNYLESR